MNLLTLLWCMPGTSRNLIGRVGCAAISAAASVEDMPAGMSVSSVPCSRTTGHLTREILSTDAKRSLHSMPIFPAIILANRRMEVKAEINTSPCAARRISHRALCWTGGGGGHTHTGHTTYPNVSCGSKFGRHA